jgi:flagellar biosynthesis protein FliR
MLNDVLVSYGLYFALVMSRIAGFVATSPFPGNYFQTQQKVGLVLTLSFLAATTIAEPLRGIDPGNFALLLLTITEAALGATMGMAFRFGMACTEVMGEFIGHATGLRVGSMFNPDLGRQGTPSMWRYHCFPCCSSWSSAFTAC